MTSKTNKKQSFIKKIFNLLKRDGFNKHRPHPKYKINRIELIEKECNDNETVILINGDIVAHIKSDTDVEYEYDDQWLKHHNYDINQIHTDFIKLLIDSEWLND